MNEPTCIKELKTDIRWKGDTSLKQGYELVNFVVIVKDFITESLSLGGGRE